MFKNYFQGSLFAQDLLDSSIAEFPEWKAYDDHDLATFESEVQSLFDQVFPQLADAIFKAAPAARHCPKCATPRMTTTARDAVGKRKEQGDIFSNDERPELQTRDGAGRSYHHSGPRLSQDAAYDRRGTIGGQAV